MTLIEKEMYSYRKYVLNKYYKHYIKAVYYFLKYKYYFHKEEKEMEAFIKNDTTIHK